MQSSDFVYNSYDYRPNRTPLSPITIIKKKYLKDKLDAVPYIWSLLGDKWMMTVYHTYLCKNNYHRKTKIIWKNIFIKW